MTREYTSSGYVDSGSTLHYGVTIPHDKPTTGVISNNTIEWLSDETMEGIDISWEEWLTDFESEHGREPTDDERDDASSCDDCSTYLIGDWTKNDDDEYAPVQDGAKGFSAIVGETYTQVVWSKTTERCALCSPCFPGQADIGTPGDYDAYTLPSDLMGTDDETIDTHRYQFMWCHAENMASGTEFFFIYYKVMDGNTTQDGIVVPSTYSAGKTITPPVIPQTS